MSAAGLGSDPIIEGSGDCLRSTNSWPVFLAEHLRDESNDPESFSFAFVACAAATVTDVRDGQLQALSERTQFVTVSVGGNDAGFGVTVAECLQSQAPDCSASIDEQQGQLPSVEADLTCLYQQVHLSKLALRCAQWRVQRRVITHRQEQSKQRCVHTRSHDLEIIRALALYCALCMHTPADPDMFM